jgi:hypothetical protein
LPPEQRKILGEYLFVCPDFHYKKIGETSVGFNELYEKLVLLPCHKLLLLDTCHSGALRAGLDSKSSPIRQLTKGGIGPVILAACETQQSAVEDESLDYGYAYGLFSIALRKTLQVDEEFMKANVNKNNKLTAKELAYGVTTLVHRYIDELRKKGVKGDDGKELEGQDPTMFLPAFEANLEVAER